jgi:hypothetical protein
VITLSGFFCIKIKSFSGKEKVVDNYFTFLKPEAEFWEKAGTNIGIRLSALPKESRQQEEDPEGRSQNQGDPEQPDLPSTQPRLGVAVSGLEDPLRVAGLVDAVPPAKADLKKVKFNCLTHLFNLVNSTAGKFFVLKLGTSKN